MIEKDKMLKIIKHKNFIVFDGECVLCSGFFQFVLQNDKDQYFSFVLAQSKFGEALYDHFDLKAEDYDTNLVFIKGELYERMHGFFAVMKTVGWPWRAVVALQVFPDKFLDWAYYRIARNRYRLFGKRSECLVVDDTLKKRFIDV